MPSRFRILFDEDLHRDIASFLRAQGHDVVFPPKGVKNGRLYKRAIQTRRVLITGDADFLNTDIHPPKKTKGILVVRIHPQYPAQVNPVLKKTLEALTAKELRGRLVILEPSGFWVEK